MPYVNKGLSTKIGPFIKDISRSTITINNQFNDHLLDLKVLVTATQSGSGNPSPENKRPISGWDSVDLSVNSVITAINLGSTYYGCALDIINGVLTVNKGYRLFDGSEVEEWRDYSIYDGFQITIPDMISTVGSIDIMSNELFRRSGASSEYPSCRIANKTLYALGITNNISGITDLSSWREWLSSNPLQFVYPLETPFDIQLTPKQIDLIAGNNTISANSGNVEAIYKTFTP